jgi:L-fuculose-phosphate aldolase
MLLKKERKEVAKYMHRLYKNRLTTAGGGNVSMKNQEGYIFITASQTDKANITAKDIIVFDNELNSLTPELKPSMEYNMHLNIYKNRPDIFAIVHSHPLYASIFSVIDCKINTCLTGEARYVLKDVEEIDYKLMGTEELSDCCVQKLKAANAAIMKNHGAITLGNTLFEAYDRMEVLEFTANMNYKLFLLENKTINSLNDNKIYEIDRLKLKNE